MTAQIILASLYSIDTDHYSSGLGHHLGKSLENSLHPHRQTVK